MSSSPPNPAAARYPAYPPPLTASEREYLLASVKDWSIAHGLAVRPAPSFVPPEQDPAGVLATTAPVTLFPSLFPRACFEEALAIQTAYNELYCAIAQDEDWLQGIVEELLDIDEFVAKLWDIHLAVKKEGYVQDLSLGLFRSDYMVHVDPEQPAAPTIKQVEFNTIASSFGGLSSRVSALHQHLRDIDAYPPAAKELITPEALPPSTSVASLSAGLASAHSAYGPSAAGHPTCILFIVQDNERNVFDQRLLEYQLLNHHHIRTFRLAFSHVLDHTSISADGKRTLLYRPPHSPATPYEVTTVYFRAGYSPTDYPTAREWDARLHLERSAAVKCPSILTHLAGTKKVQQVLATPQSPHLARFLRDPTAQARLRRTFAPIYPLDAASAAGREGRRLATDPATAARFVLKPQREGGGNNVYRTKIPPFLRDALPDPTRWPAYVLMEMIEPPPQRNAILRHGHVVVDGGVICELGVYGTALWRHRPRPSDDDDRADGSASRAQPVLLLENECAGWLLRTKGDTSEEGGVAAGFGAVDSVCLV